MNMSTTTKNIVRRGKKKSYGVLPLGLNWSHLGTAWRVTAWPEARFESVYGDEWIPASPSEDVLASAAQTCTPADWRRYLEYTPAEVRDFVSKFSFMRMEALQVATRCASLLPVLAETPALTAFVAGHVNLRGVIQPAWGEIEAVFERNGVFGLLEWLGLPASRQTLEILQHFAEPDVSKRLLAPLRTILWEPRAIFALQKVPAITDRQLAGFCHALAA